ncbi:DUF6662 family protein [Luteibacter yeojuensis]|uniref:Uncharacterized protein n=1 Tax=Luteibacter yeojuensis TaxID=345309 RepID=A0A0F3KXL6_9GAMM|nr:DUF6662 family protein [Luteibacter yeojuensis]KJV35687.1 hypothetical protein VI08_06685 [Luteibacter yeojuensis]
MSSFLGRSAALAVVACLALGAAGSWAPPARAGEAIFGYVYTTDLLPKGKSELEQWATDRKSQAYGSFNAYNFSTEYEYGVTDNFQIGTYLNYTYEQANGNSVRGKTEGIDLSYKHDPNKPFSGAHVDGVSMEFLYRVLSPYKDGIGLAFYAEPEYGPRERGLELRAIVQKNLMDDRLVLAANVWVEAEKERGSNLIDPYDTDPEPPTRTMDKATYAEIDLGGSYRFASNWSAGLEIRNHNEFGGWTLLHRNQDHTAFFAGPNVHYAARRWYATLSVLRQIHAITYSEEQDHQRHDGLLYGDEHTRWDGIRLKIGYSFD